MAVVQAKSDHRPAPRVAASLREVTKFRASAAAARDDETMPGLGAQPEPSQSRFATEGTTPGRGGGTGPRDGAAQGHAGGS
jgi:hypothetical protein